VTDHGVDVLAFGPHPDDVELRCGGTVIRLGQLGGDADPTPISSPRATEATEALRDNPFPEAHAFEPPAP
jgi:LmbE family N-acetylglucosaminyl deacetylase